jgi:hypothetical protein
MDDIINIKKTEDANMKINLTTEYRKRVEAGIIEAQIILNKEMSRKEHLRNHSTIVEMQLHIDKMGQAIENGYIEA